MLHVITFLRLFCVAFKYFGRDPITGIQDELKVTLFGNEVSLIFIYLSFTGFDSFDLVLLYSLLQ